VNRDPESTRRKQVLVTGAEGIIGEVVRKHLSDRYDLRFLTWHPAAFPSHVADVSDFDAIRPAFSDVDAVVHLAAAANGDDPWDDILRSNIVGTYNVFEAARRAGVETVVFTSSNHVVGWYEVEAGPALYRLGDPRVLDTRTEVRPDSLYAVSKVFGEALGRYYVDRYRMRVICIRIGSCPPQDDPRFASVFGLDLKPEERYLRQRAAWLSQPDCAQLIWRAIEAPVRWAVVYGISDNPRQFWDLSTARELLGYHPEGHAPPLPDPDGPFEAGRGLTTPSDE
jgi:nucleoside-diphosphate-sugar epimerase